MRFSYTLTVLSSFTLASTAFAQLNIGTTDASDGALSVVSSTRTLNLAEAAPALWNAPAPVPGKGVFDTARWAVVYKLSSLSIDSSSTLNFLNHPSGAPVVLLIQGNATIDGIVNVSALATADTPGPGGFYGGLAGDGTTIGSAGLGPGGGAAATASGDAGGNGSYGTVGLVGSPQAPAGSTYGMPNILQLIGGSGGGANFTGGIHYGGGHGGGAILLVVRGTLTMNGQILANGGQGSSGGSGSGGAVRLIANSIQFGSNHSLSAQGANNFTVAGAGRIRVEANSTIGLPASNPVASLVTPGLNARVWPAATDPSVRISTINGTVIPAEPRGQLRNIDLAFETASSVPVDIITTNTPVDGSWRVELRGVNRFGAAVVYTATLIAGNQGSATWRVTLPPFSGVQSLQPRVVKV